MSVGISIIPSITLLGVNHGRLLADYKSGKFDRPLPDHAPIRFATNSTIIAKTYSTNTFDAMYSIENKNKVKTIIVTTNHSNFSTFLKNQEIQEGGVCDCCKITFTQAVTSYPISYDEQFLPVQNEEGEILYQAVFTFWTEGEFCSYECALCYLRTMAARPSCKRDDQLSCSERHLKWLYLLTYPEAGPLMPANHYRLRDGNGGSLTDEEFRDSNHSCIKTVGVLLIPAKREYIRRPFNRV
jgi:hypothetical protein